MGTSDILLGVSLQWTSILSSGGGGGGVAILLVASSNTNWVKFPLCGIVTLACDFTFTLLK